MRREKERMTECRRVKKNRLKSLRERWNGMRRIERGRKDRNEIVRKERRGNSGMYKKGRAAVRSLMRPAGEWYEEDGG